jgi:hypothetical protein
MGVRPGAVHFTCESREYSIGMAIAFAVALTCYAIGLFAAPAGKPLETQDRLAYCEGMKVSFTYAAVRAMSPPVAAV